MLSILLALALLQQPGAAPTPEAPAESAPPPTALAPPAARPASPPKAVRRSTQEAPGERPVLKGFGRPSGKRFTGEFDDTEVDDALRQIAKAGGLSIVLPDGHRHERISATFEDAPVEEALRAVLAQAGLFAERQGAIITVREEGGLSGFSALGQGIGREVERRANEALREADRETRRTERETRRAEREAERERRRAQREGDQASKGADRGGTHGRDRVVQGDAVVRAGESVRDVVAMRGSVRLEPGSQARDAVAILGSVSLEPGAQARAAVAIGGDVRVGPGAQIGRDAVSIGGEVKADPSAEIGGETTAIGVPELSGLTSLFGSRTIFGHASSPLWKLGQALAKFVVYFVLALALLALFPRRVDAVSAGFTTHPWKSVLTGLLGLAVAPIVIVLLVATIIGIPLVPVAAIMLLAAGVLGFTSLASYIGRALPLKVQRNAQVLQLAIGTAMIVVVTQIPVVGAMAWVAAALLTFGAVLRTRFGSQTPALATTLAPPPPPPPAAPA